VGLDVMTDTERGDDDGDRRNANFFDYQLPNYSDGFQYPPTLLNQRCSIKLKWVIK